MVFIYKNKKGFTLIEALISIVIIAIIGFVISNIIISAFFVVNMQRVYLNLQQETATTLKKLGETTKESISIVNYPEDIPTYFTDSDTLALKVIGVDTDGTPLHEIYDYFIYYLDGNILKLQIDADPLSSGREDKSININNFVDKIIFRYNTIDPLNSDMITITLISSDEIGSKIKTIKAQTSAYIRN